MPEILCFSRSRCTSVKQVDDNTIKSWCRLDDTTMEAFVEITVNLPDLDIADIVGEVRRTDQAVCTRPADYLTRLIGVRIGPGMLKIIKGLMEDMPYCKQLAFMVEECCHGIILSFTKNVLKKAPTDEADVKKFFTDMVTENVRLYNRCAAFSPGSPLVDGIEPPG